MAGATHRVDPASGGLCIAGVLLAGRRLNVKYAGRIDDKVEGKVILFSSLEREPGSASPALSILVIYTHLNKAFCCYSNTPLGPIINDSLQSMIGA
jgi:hypothetical protein